MIQTQPSEEPSSMLLRTMVAVDLLLFGLLPIATWIAAAFASSWFFSQSELIAWPAPAEGFAGYLMIYCLPVEAARIGLLIAGVRIWTGSTGARTAFLLLLISLSLLGVCAAGTVASYKETSVFAGPSVAVHLAVSGLLIGATVLAVWRESSQPDPVEKRA